MNLSILQHKKKAQGCSLRLEILVFSRVGHGLLLRHASQNSLDESSQRNPSNSPEEDEFKTPYTNPSHFETAFSAMNALRK